MGRVDGAQRVVRQVISAGRDEVEHSEAMLLRQVDWDIISRKARTRGRYGWQTRQSIVVVSAKAVVVAIAMARTPRELIVGSIFILVRLSFVVVVLGMVLTSNECRRVDAVTLQAGQM